MHTIQNIKFGNVLELMEILFRQNLLQWFEENARQLPWRIEPNLYKTVVSEFMLQQTQVKTVLPYFEQWMARYPSFQVLAQADEAEIMSNWAGLGYYSRAHNLYAFAKKYCEEPITSFSELKQINGIGDYIAAAIASISFNEPIAVVDGNVVRVLARIFNHAEAFRTKSLAVQFFRNKAQNLLDKTQPGKFNEALMELGAVCCTKQNPTCKLCPLITLCEAFKANTVAECPKFIQLQRSFAKRERIWLANEDSLVLEPSTVGGRIKLLELPFLTQERKDLFGKLEFLFKGKRSIGMVTYTEEVFQPNRVLAIHELLQFESFQGCIAIPLKRLSTCALSGPHKRWILQILKDRTIIRAH